MVYQEASVDRYDIWTYRATLNLSGVSRVVLELRGDLNGSLDDAMLFDVASEISDWVRLLRPVPATRLLATFTAGATLEVDCSGAHLILGARLQLVDTWEGAL